jgi:hypothetical protein
MALETYLARSSADGPFRSAVERFAREGTPCARIRFNAGCPPVKVARTLTKILEAFPRLEIEDVDLEARSGCEYFRGTVRIRSAASSQEVRFEWDCKWRAEEQGWTDCFGFPDQARAAREFGWDCFRVWEPRERYAEAS